MFSLLTEGQLLHLEMPQPPVRSVYIPADAAAIVLQERLSPLSVDPQYCQAVNKLHSQRRSISYSHDGWG